MRHRKGFNTLGLKASHRRALLRNMVTSLFRYEKVKTTKAKALEVRKKAEKLITRAKVDSVHNRRIVAKFIWDKDIVGKLFTEIGPKYANRPGGYTRILKLGQRKGDAADIVLLQLVEEEVESDKGSKKKKAAKKSTEKAAAKAEKEEKGAKEVTKSEEKVEEASAEPVAE